jgi:hypothetical protein
MQLVYRYTVAVECGDGTKLGNLVNSLNRNHEMYNISTMVPIAVGGCTR